MSGKGTTGKKCYPLELAQRMEALIDAASIAHATQQTEYVEKEANSILEQLEELNCA